MSNYVSILVGAIVALMLAYLLRTHPSWWFLRERDPDERPWQDLFTPREMPVVQSALQAVVEAFLLRKSDIYRLRPSDRLLAIYRAAYPDKQAPDGLEFETLSKQLVSKFHVPEAIIAEERDPCVEDVVRWCLRYSGA